MPAAKCISCKRWSIEGGCNLTSYTMIRQCMLEKADYSIIEEGSVQKNDRDADDRAGLLDTVHG